MNPIFIIFTVLNILIMIIDIFTFIKMRDIEADVILEKAGLINATKNTVTPIAEIKAELSEEDIKKFKEMLKEAKPQFIPDDKPCEHDHTYDSIILEKDELHCCEYLIFKCSTCGHEEKIRTTSHLLRDLILNGGLSV